MKSLATMIIEDIEKWEEYCGTKEFNYHEEVIGWGDSVGTITINDMGKSRIRAIVRKYLKKKIPA